MRRAVEAFEGDFARWDLHLPIEAVEARRAGQIRHAGWSVRYNFGRDARGEYLDYYASPRDVERDAPTDDWHVRLYDSGERVALPTVLEAYMYGRDPTWEELERTRRKYAEGLGPDASVERGGRESLEAPIALEPAAEAADPPPSGGELSGPTRTHHSSGDVVEDGAAAVDGVPSWDQEPWGAPAAADALPEATQGQITAPQPPPKKVFRRADLVLTADVASIDGNVDPDIFKPWWFRPTARRVVLGAAAVFAVLAAIALMRHRPRVDAAQAVGAEADTVASDPAPTSTGAAPASAQPSDASAAADSASGAPDRADTATAAPDETARQSAADPQPDAAASTPEPAVHGSDDGMAKPAGPQSLPVIVPSGGTGAHATPARSISGSAQRPSP